MALSAFAHPCLLLAKKLNERDRHLLDSGNAERHVLGHAISQPRETFTAALSANHQLSELEGSHWRADSVPRQRLDVLGGGPRGAARSFET